MLAAGEIYIPDTSVFLDGSLKEYLQSNGLKGRLLIHTGVVKYFEDDAKVGSSLGILGLEEVAAIHDMASKIEGITVEYVDVIPRSADLKDPESLVLNTARELGAVLITSDAMVKKVCEAMGIRYIYIGKGTGALEIEKWFQKYPDTMSIHLKENTLPMAKRGAPGNWELVYLDNKVLSKEYLERLVREVISTAYSGGNGAVIEVKRSHSLIVQYRDIRIVAVFPPVSDGIEITAVRPLVKKRVEEYNLHPKVVERLEKRAEGILIGGAPGAGKTTFAQALAEFFVSKNKVVKTIESPRDMVLPDQVTQLSKNLATPEELHDILLLSRPDYTIFDEMRDTADIQLYVDLRLAGIGMVGVIHATSPIDSIQRFIGRVELGMLPSIVDTVIFIDKGLVSKVYSLEMTVKIPAGLKEEDLARPVVVVKDFITEEPEYEVYVFGEETFVVPLKRRSVEVNKRAMNQLLKVVGKYVPLDQVIVEPREDVLVIKVPQEYYGLVLSKGLPRIGRIKRRFRVDVRIEPRQ
ncbi:PINc/VapC family ATPase [Caldivirga maquilingensis]|uniref:Type II secretion system protein E n=1 Tax=Caldivirga maquilingensis (strain ATCC 700844 / DSM 13496 / JCM 10307 / IC-167) TaxID=397948 RepID=A8MB56_CALMQ|nr:PINc/VapC family ATPase [Caldivirga maquilingensis]ABW01146.1 type II secretion system protein E [Caldivirga maquilingensis IC-167]